MPSGSTRLTVAFLYSFPLIVLKSSVGAIDAKHTIKIKKKLGVLTSATLGFSGEAQVSESQKKSLDKLSFLTCCNRIALEIGCRDCSSQKSTWQVAIRDLKFTI
jgi:hypothetical protein